MIRFTDELRALKAKKGLTGAELSQKSGVPVGTLNKLLTGVVEDPKLSVAIDLCNALDTPLETVLSQGIGPALTPDEEKLLSDYRSTDPYGKVLIRRIAEMECGRATDSESGDSRSVRPIGGTDEQMISLPLYLLPVSAGTGIFLDSAYHESVSLRADSAAGADFALKVSGNSMEPKFQSGDILLVHQQDRVQFGELGIFVADGEGYFKRFMGDRLHSLNPEYPDIPLIRFESFICCGKVVGHMKRKS